MSLQSWITFTFSKIDFFFKPFILFHSLYILHSFLEKQDNPRRFKQFMYFQLSGRVVPCKRWTELTLTLPDQQVYRVHLQHKLKKLHQYLSISLWNLAAVKGNILSKHWYLAKEMRAWEIDGTSCLRANAPPELQLKSSINTMSTENVAGCLRVKFMKLLYACTEMKAGMQEWN